MPSFSYSTVPVVTYPFTCAGVDEAKVKKAFETVAKAMKPGERAALRQYWFAQQVAAPTFSVEDTLYFEVERDDGPFRALAMNVNGHGLAFRFAGKSMHHMFEHGKLLVETLIAHELAHAVIMCEIKNDDLPDEDAESYLELTKILDAKTEGVTDEAELLAIMKANFHILSEWTEAAVNHRIKTWNEHYDDEKVRAWFKYLVENDAPPPPPPAPEAAGF